MNRKHTRSDSDPFDPIDNCESHIGPTRLKCECVTDEAYEKLRSLISTVSEQLSVMGDEMDTKSTRDKHQKLRSTLNLVKKTQNELRKGIQHHHEYRKNFSRQNVDMIKRHAINVPPNRAPLVVTPHKVGIVTQPKPSKLVFLKRNAASILPVTKLHGLTKLETPEENSGATNNGTNKNATL